jgi:hypothetical protein
LKRKKKKKRKMIFLTGEMSVDCKKEVEVKEQTQRSRLVTRKGKKKNVREKGNRRCSE